MAIFDLLFFFIGVLLSTFILVKIPKWNYLKNSLLMFSYSITIWLLINFFNVVKSPNYFWYCNSYGMGAIMCSAGFMLYTSFFLQRKANWRLHVLIYSIGFIIYAVTMIEDFVFIKSSMIWTGVGIDQYEIQQTEWALLFFGYLLVTIVWLTTSMLICMKKFKKDRVRRHQALFFFLGIIAFAINAFITSFFMPMFGFTGYTSLDTVGALMFVVFASYAITKYHFLGIDTVIHKTLLWSISVIIAVLPVGVAFELLSYGRQFVPVLRILFNSFLFVFFWACFGKVKIFIDHLFRIKKYDYIKDLLDIPNNLGIYFSLGSLCERLFDDMQRAIFFRNGLIAVKLLSKDKYEEKYSIGYDRMLYTGLLDKKEFISINNNHFLIKFINSTKDIVDVARIKTYPDSLEKRRIIDFMKKHGLIVIIPMFLNTELVGFMGLGKMNNLRLYSDMELKSLQIVGNKVAMMVKNTMHYSDILEKERISEEMAIGKRIQRSLLPKDAPVICNDTRFYGKNITAKEIGGDYYDFIPLDNHRSLIVIGDVTGKGVSAGLLMSVAKTAVHIYAKEKQDPAFILKKVNAHFYSNDEAESFMTMVIGIWNTKTRVFKYASAGHEPILHYVNCIHEIRELFSTGTLLGAIEKLDVKNKSVSLATGDALLLYTDGVTDANRGNEMYGLSRLKEIYLKLYSDHKGLSLLDKIKNDVMVFSGSGTLRDDITMIFMEVGVDYDSI